MHYFKLAVLPCYIMLVGCVGDFTPFKTDNAYVRALQTEETAKYFPEASRRAELKQKTGGRVGLIRYVHYIADSGTPTFTEEFSHGRGAAITSDGYYLTAYHVVNTEPFRLVDVKLKQPLESGPVKGDPEELIERSELTGRLVWSNPDHDLAIVKFDQTNVPCFETMRIELNRGEIVHSADDQGSWIELPPSDDGSFDWNDRYGNGSFFSAGKVLTSKGDGAHQEYRQQHTTLVARGAMSGAPLVAMSGELCGILSFATAPQLNQPATCDASMASPCMLMEIIEADRKRNR